MDSAEKKVVGLKPLVATSLDLVMEKLCDGIKAETVEVSDSELPLLKMTDRIFREVPKLISKLEQDYDYVIIPSPPMLANIDPNDYQIKFVVLVHDLPAIGEEGLLGSKVRKKSLETLSDVDLVLTMSKETREDLIRHTSGIVDVNDLDIEVLIQGVDTERIYRNQKQPSVDIPEDYILYTGAFQDRKNPEFLIDVLEKLPEKFQLVCCGDYLNEDRFEKFLIYSDKRGLRSRVHDVGYVSIEDLRMIYSNASVYLHPARFEGFGRTPVEAAVCGTRPIMYEGIPSSNLLGGKAEKFDNFKAQEVAKKIEQNSGEQINYSPRTWEDMASEFKQKLQMIH